MSTSSTNPTPDTRAFPAQPRLDRYYASASIEAARRRLVQCLLRGDGPALLLGAPGIGKTMLLDVLEAEVSNKLSVVRLGAAQLCTRRALLQAILHGLNEPFRDREEGELRIALSEILANPSITGAGVALLVDEAQTMPQRLLEELRLLTNQSVDGLPRVRLILAGTHALDETFTASDLESFSQRLAARCYLEPLTRAEVSEYVRAHVAAAGGDPDRLFADDAYEALVRASDGLPRLINQVADRALMLATEQGTTLLDADAIGAAWSDMHHLAAPWQAPSKARIAATTTPAEVEFGALDDLDPSSDEVVEQNSEDLIEALHAEVAAMAPMSETPIPESGVWDADHKLRELTSGSLPESSSEDEGPVSYAFPGVSEEEQVEPADDIPELVDPEVASNGNDPFAEEFDEEEIVIDPHADREQVIPGATPVEAIEETDLAAAYQSLTAEIEQPIEAAPLEEVTADPVEIAPQTEAVSEEEILLIEQDNAELSDGGARRVDYADLFTSLRLG